jgi:hypothetical protein
MSEKIMSTTIPLKCGPYKLDGKEITEVTIRRGKVRDSKAARRQAEGNSADYETIMISNLTGLPVEFIDELDLYDYGNLQETYADFTRTPPETSPKT